MTQRRGGVNINMHSFINFSFDCKRIFFREKVMSIGQTFFLSELHKCHYLITQLID